jgi:hypothetical protein
MTFIASLLLLAGYFYQMGSHLYPLTANDIMTFEMARTERAATTVLNVWQQNDKKKELLLNSVYWDYGLVVLYVLVISLSCRFFSLLTKSEVLLKAGQFFSVIIVAAGVCNVVHNMLMIRMLSAGVSEFLTGWTYFLALTKFSIIVICLLFIFFCLLLYLLSLIGKEQRNANFSN